LVVGQAAVFVDQGDGVWTLLHLLLEQLMDELLFRIVSFGRIPFHQQLIALGLAQ
jgi:hypothetical protein